MARKIFKQNLKVELDRYQDFTAYLVNCGIPSEITNHYKVLDFIQSQFEYVWDDDNKDPAYDFGKHEWRYVQTLDCAIKKIKSMIIAGIIDVDQNGRDITQKRLKQFLANPHKGFCYSVCKAYYLYRYNISGDPEASGEFAAIMHTSFDKSFANIWNKHIQLNKARFLRRLSA